MSIVATQLDAETFDFVRTLVLERSAIVLEPSKTYLVETRLAPLAREHSFASLRDLVASLRGKPFQKLHQQVVEALTTNETSFFRDVHPFETLKTAILPEMIAKRAAQKALNVWCGACSSGQEPYTICMLLREHFPQLKDWKVQLTGSDLSRQILDRARQAVFSQAEVNRGLPAPLLVKYFTKQGLHWALRDDVRSMVQYIELNLIEAWPPLPPLDIIFLRNVLIYFSAETKKAILAKIRRLLRPDGYLFLGGAETTINLDDNFERVQLDKTTCYRLRGPATAPR